MVVEYDIQSKLIYHRVIKKFVFPWLNVILCLIKFNTQNQSFISYLNLFIFIISIVPIK